MGPNRASRERRASIRSPTAGTMSASPKAKRTTTATVRVAPSARPTPSTTVASSAIVTTNVIVSPVTMPSGRRFPPVALADSSAGRTGSTHGEMAVPAPASSAKRVSRTIASLWEIRARRYAGPILSPAPMAERGGIDPITKFLGFRWTAADEIRLNIEEKHMNGGGLLSGAVTFALVDYCMGSTLWRQRNEGEGIATINISINYVQTALAGEIVCKTTLDRRNKTLAVLSSEVRDDEGRLLVSAIGSYTIFRKRPEAAQPAE